ncbi:MAG: c-type cytochrome [Geminicoccaceae bacterium]
MADLELNKIFGAVLLGGIVAVGSGVFSGLLYHPHVPEEAHYALETTEDGGGAAEEEEVTPLPVLLANADPAAGETVAKKCTACHEFAQGGANKVGPALYGVLGRDIASHDGFAYSDVLNEKEGDWDYEKMNAFLENPKDWAPGTKMSFAGLRKPEDRADVMAYMRDMSDEPLPLPEADAAAEEAPADGEESPAEAEDAPTEGDTDTGGETSEGETSQG